VVVWNAEVATERQLAFLYSRMSREESAAVSVASTPLSEAASPQLPGKRSRTTSASVGSKTTTARSATPPDPSKKSAETSALVIPGPHFERPHFKSKGSHARFLGQNPRYINEPVCQIRPNDGGYSVKDCLSWNHQQCQRFCYITN